MSSTLRLSLSTNDGEPLLLTYSNTGESDFSYHPDHFLLTVDLGPCDVGREKRVTYALRLPAGWTSDPDGPIQAGTSSTTLVWKISPAGRPTGFSMPVRVVGHGMVRAEVQVPVVLEGYSQFQPRTHGFPFANRASDLGHIRATREAFDRTFRVAPLRDRFFAGLYQAIVFIGGRSGESYHGGLCTGMSRAALERSLDPSNAMPDLDTVVLWHGRQLTDRALLASLPWFLFPSPRRAFYRFRDAVLATGAADICFDIAVPRPWRRDIVTALMREGHTVVPFGFRQDDQSTARVFVYDPNHPWREVATEVMTFDLAADRYAYRSHARLDERDTTVVAVSQAPYRCGHTAIMSSIASLVLFTLPKSRYVRGVIGRLAALLLAVSTARHHRQA